MITKLSVSNFKSVRQLDIECKKVNLFIGVRFQTMPNLFYDQLLDQDIAVKASTSDTSYPKLDVTLKHDKSKFIFLQGREPFRVVTYEGKADEAPMLSTIMARIKLFRFKSLDRYDSNQSESLRPPNGDNLFSVVISSKSLRETMTEFFRKYGLKLVMKPHEKVFELQKEVDSLVFSYPYTLPSDTLRGIIFYTVAIASNKDSVLVFEEPESNAFPYYTKYLGERIALDQTNQFFIATHNPYLLSAVIEKTGKEDVQVFITYFKDFQTRVKPLMPDQVVELMEADPFFNLDHFIEEEE